MADLAHLGLKPQVGGQLVSFHHNKDHLEVKTSYRKILALLGVLKRLVGFIYPLGFKVLSLLKDGKRTNRPSIHWEQLPWKFTPVDWYNRETGTYGCHHCVDYWKSGKTLRNPVKLAPNQFDLFVDADSQTEEELMRYYICAKVGSNGLASRMDDLEGREPDETEMKEILSSNQTVEEPSPSRNDELESSPIWADSDDSSPFR